MKRARLHFSPQSIPVCAVRLLILVFALAVGGRIAQGQEVSNKRGFQPGNSYSLGDFETINTTNGNVMLHFPLGKLAAGRGAVDAGINLVYNSKLYDSQLNYYRNEAYNCTYVEEGPVTCPYYTKNLLDVSEEGGWQYFLGFRLKMEDRRTQYSNVPSQEQPQCRDQYGGIADGYLTMTYVHKLFVIYPDGSRHEMIPNSYANDVLLDRYFKVRYDGVLEDCGGNQQRTGAAMAYHSVDGTFVRLEFSYDNDWDRQSDDSLTSSIRSLCLRKRATISLTRSVTTPLISPANFHRRNQTALAKLAE